MAVCAFCSTTSDVVFQRHKLTEVLVCALEKKSSTVFLFLFCRLLLSTSWQDCWASLGAFAGF